MTSAATKSVNKLDTVQVWNSDQQISTAET